MNYLASHVTEGQGQVTPAGSYCSLTQCRRVGDATYIPYIFVQWILLPSGDEVHALYACLLLQSVFFQLFSKKA